MRPFFRTDFVLILKVKQQKMKPFSVDFFMVLWRLYFIFKIKCSQVVLYLRQMISDRQHVFWPKRFGQSKREDPGDHVRGQRRILRNRIFGVATWCRIFRPRLESTRIWREFRIALPISNDECHGRSRSGNGQPKLPFLLEFSNTLTEQRLIDINKIFRVILELRLILHSAIQSYVND